MFKNLATNLIVPIVVLAMLFGPVAATFFAISHQTHTTITTPPVSSTPVPTDPGTVQTQTTIVQFSSHTTVKEAQKALVALNSLGLFDITDVRLYKATLPNGTWYRVALPVKDLAAGNKLCDAWKAKGNDCLVLQFT